MDSKVNLVARLYAEAKEKYGERVAMTMYGDPEAPKPEGVIVAKRQPAPPRRRLRVTVNREPVGTIKRRIKTVGRNDPCPCGKKVNGKPVKFKHCHLGKGGPNQ